MLALLIVSVVLGGTVAVITGMGFLFWIVAIAICICGLPAALITGFIRGEVDHAQDRADYREEMRQLAEEERELMREIREDERYERYWDQMDKLGSKYSSITYNFDARSVHYHEQPKSRPRDAHGRFLSSKPNRRKSD